MSNLKKREYNKSLLVLCAGAKSYHADFCLIEPLLNIGNTLVIDRIRKGFNNVRIKIYIAYSDKFDHLEKIESFKGLNFINVGRTKGVIETIKLALNFIDEKYVEIIPITTIPNKKYANKKAIYFGDKEIFKECWSSVEYLKNNDLKFLSKKNKSHNFKFTYPFTGRISSSKKDILNALKYVLEDEKDDLINLARILYEKNKYEIIHEKWFDLGHSITYLQTKNQDISSRSFNNLKYNEKKDTITKTSENSSIISSEIDFYTSIPNKFKRYFPHLLLENNKNKTLLEMEYISFPNIAEIFLFRKMGPNFWEKLVNSLFYIYEGFYKKSEINQYENLSWLYSYKLKDRFQDLENNLTNLKCFNMGSIINNETLINKKIRIPSLSKTIKKILIFLNSFENSRPLCFGHGDLCFNNILVEPVSISVKLIDPKASKKSSSGKIGLMDPLYDLAKLNHSFCCLYDSIVNNLFIFEQEQNNIEFYVVKSPNYDVASFYFKKIFGKYFTEPKNLRLITASLFLSMLPLHKENNNRVAALSIIGICLFHNIDIRKFLFKI